MFGRILRLVIRWNEDCESDPSLRMKFFNFKNFLKRNETNACGTCYKVDGTKILIVGLKSRIKLDTPGMQKRAYVC